jgi:hypothetical protein
MNFMPNESFESINDPATLIEVKSGEEAEFFEDAYKNTEGKGKLQRLVVGFAQAEGLMTQQAVEEFVNKSEQV